MGKVILLLIYAGILVLVASLFAKRGYTVGCKDEVLEVVDAVATVTGEPDMAEQLKQLLFNQCESKARAFGLKELFK